MATPRPWPDLLVSLFVMLIGAVALWQAAVIPASPLYAQVGPRLVPYAIGAAMLALGACLLLVALRGGWSHGLAEQAEAPAVNARAALLMAAGLGANLLLIGFAGFAIAATAQFVLVAAAFGSRRPLRDVGIGAALSLGAFFLFVEALGVNIGAGLAEGAILRLLGRETI